MSSLYILMMIMEMIGPSLIGPLILTSTFVPVLVEALTLFVSCVVPTMYCTGRFEGHSNLVLKNLNDIAKLESAVSALPVTTPRMSLVEEIVAP